MKLATWNVNSLKVRLPQVLDWAGKHRPDVLCLQETKLEDANFPHAEIGRAGYQVLCCGQKTYNGVAILSRTAATECAVAIPGLEDAQKRVLAATFDGVRVVCAYVPNGENLASEKFRYKLAWLAAFRDWLKSELAAHPRLAVVGDYNIAPEARDVHDPAAWENKIHFTAPEREAFAGLLATAGWGKHSILYEYTSLEAREERFIPHEEQAHDGRSWTARILPQLVHAPCSPAVGRKIWPA